MGSELLGAALEVVGEVVAAAPWEDLSFGGGRRGKDSGPGCGCVLLAGATLALAGGIGYLAWSDAQTETTGQASVERTRTENSIAESAGRSIDILEGIVQHPESEVAELEVSQLEETLAELAVGELYLEPGKTQQACNAAKFSLRDCVQTLKENGALAHREIEALKDARQTLVLLKATVLGE